MGYGNGPPPGGDPRYSYPYPGYGDPRYGQRPTWDRRPAPVRRRPRRWIAAVLAVVAVAEVCAGVAALTQVRGRDTAATLPGGGVYAGPKAAPAPLPNGGGSAEQDRDTAVRGLLEQRGRALLARNKAGWLAAVDPAASAFRAKQAALFDNLAGVPLTAWKYTVDGPGSRKLTAAATGHYRGAQLWTPRVQLHYALKYADTEPTARAQVLTFVRRAGRWYLASDADPVADGTKTWRGLWDFGPVVSRRGRFSLVLAHPANADRLDTFAAGVDSAVPRVNAVWGTAWPRQVALLIPDSNTELAALVGQQFASARIAAVAIADVADVSTNRALGQRVVVNPSNLDRLGPTGRQIVLAHEITHIASRALTGDGMPTWLVEGFADFVGYRDSGLPVTVIGQELRQQVRAGSWPGRLPADTDFRGNSPRLASAYEEGWSACRLIADRIGVPGLVRFYRQVGTTAGGGATAVDAALRQQLKMSTAQFLAAWQQSVRTELG